MREDPVISPGLLKLLGAVLGVGVVVAAIFLISDLDLEIDLDELTSTGETTTLEEITLEDITLPQPQLEPQTKPKQGAGDERPGDGSGAATEIPGISPQAQRQLDRAQKQLECVQRAETIDELSKCASP